MSTISRISSAPCGQTHCGPQIYPISRPRTALSSLFSFLVVADFDVDSLYQLPLLLTAGEIWSASAVAPLAMFFCFERREIHRAAKIFTYVFFLEGVKIIPRHLRKCRSLFISVFLKVSLALSALSQGTLVLQHPDLCRTKDRISCALPPDFLPDPFVFSSFLAALKFAARTLGSSLDR